MTDKNKIENQIIYFLAKMNLDLPIIDSETDLILDLNLSKRQIYIIGWQLCILYDVITDIPENISNHTISEMAKYFMEEINRSV